MSIGGQYLKRNRGGEDGGEMGGGREGLEREEEEERLWLGRKKKK